MESKTYYLGVNSIEKAMDVVDILSFCTVVDRRNVQIQITNSDRIRVGIRPNENPEGAILFITGAFTNEEMREIETLSKYEYESLRESISELVTKTAIDLQKRYGRGITQHILGKAN